MEKIRQIAAGKGMADALIEFIHMMHNKATARGVLNALINRLKERMGEFKDIGRKYKVYETKAKR